MKRNPTLKVGFSLQEFRESSTPCRSRILPQHVPARCPPLAAAGNGKLCGVSVLHSLEPAALPARSSERLLLLRLRPRCSHQAVAPGAARSRGAGLVLGRGHLILVRRRLGVQVRKQRGARAVVLPAEARKGRAAALGLEDAAVRAGAAPEGGLRAHQVQHLPRRDVPLRDLRQLHVVRPQHRGRLPQVLEVRQLERGVDRRAALGCPDEEAREEVNAAGVRGGEQLLERPERLVRDAEHEGLRRGLLAELVDLGLGGLSDLAGDAHEHVARVVADEKRLAVDQLREDAPGRPHVHLCCVRLATHEKLWCAVPARDNVISEFRVDARGDSQRVCDVSTQTQVTDFEAALRINDEVCWLQIAVDDARGVHVAQAIEELEDQTPHMLRRESLRGFDDLLQVRLHQLRHYVHIQLRVRARSPHDNVLHAHNVRMPAQVTQEPNFPEQSLGCSFVCCGIRYFLDRYLGPTGFLS
mmetsp:Transcript_21656/g.33110  ORF Transcript_21656/g.33110 Transcript_21656/m.33110 type:complete len:470 (+) Transcript_21656:207-1616(+)